MNNLQKTVDAQNQEIKKKGNLVILKEQEIKNLKNKLEEVTTRNEKLQNEVIDGYQKVIGI